jgi:cysteine-S-conjugate beta-lyase
MAPSKTFNIAGLGLSFAVIPNKKLREQVVAAKQGIVPWPNALSYIAALAAYREGEEWLMELIDYLRINRDIVERKISAIHGLSCAHVEATYLAWIDVRPLGLENPHQFFEKAGVGLSNGKEFAGDGFLRLNFGCPRSMLEEALERMERAANSL